LWWRRYNRYLASPAWHAKRLRVFRRAGFVCEYCETTPAVQAHHLRYPQGCPPGSRAWRKAEKLSDLKAVCMACHESLHS